ncbi:MarR family winged helix-turn-helix transcriptional regulator [Entomobacter blattae]|uniref:MarR family protein n=1 Tax=Entomobacter blattae TaxID=2762277 RepID=A0A7H1NST1_9PROT|nr:MarR family transcriptional regulator [Entomobacter blattae]QNT78841.1 MarR family protein [Entomobacter blattae]
MSSAERELLYLKEEQLRKAQTVIFFVGRDLWQLGRAVLEEHNLGQAHYRALQMLAHYPGLTVGGLLELLNITKQSLGRVMKDLLEKGFIQIHPSCEDKRKKHLFLTDSGQKIEEDVFNALKARLYLAFKEAGSEAIEGFRKVMFCLMNHDTRYFLESFKKD